MSIGQVPACPGGINFTHADFALLCARNGKEAGARFAFTGGTGRAPHRKLPSAPAKERSPLPPWDPLLAGVFCCARG